MKPRSKLALLTLLLGLVSVTQASADTMEERLRAQLRNTAQQLQTLQSEQARNAAARQSAESQLGDAQAQIKQLTTQLAAASGRSQQLAAQQDSLQQHAQAQVAAQAAASNEQVGKFKQAYEELLTMARAKEAERAKLATQLAERDTQVKQCAVQNQQMYGIAKNILAAYERVDMADVLKMHEPFAGSARVKFEEMAQAFGDDLYKTQFDGATAPTSH